MRFAVICNACIKAKRSAKKCKDLGHQEHPEEAGMEAAAAGLASHNLFGSQAAAGSFCRAHLQTVIVTVIWTRRQGFWKEQQAVLLTVCDRGLQTCDDVSLPRL